MGYDDEITVTVPQEGEKDKNPKNKQPKSRVEAKYTYRIPKRRDIYKTLPGVAYKGVNSHKNIKKGAKDWRYKASKRHYTQKRDQG